jgi:uncharacterized protein YbjT (DUF2867 family)
LNRDTFQKEKAMNRVLVTGAAGALGSKLLDPLLKSGFTVRATSRRKVEHPNVEWVQADLETGLGIDAAIEEMDVVIHAASSPFKNGVRVDVDGTRRLLESSKAAGVRDFLYVSIVGIDRIPFAYYKNKLAAEKLVSESDLNWSILRATQFHTLLDIIFQTAARYPLMTLPVASKFQVIDVGEVAEHIATGVKEGRSGRWPDIGGPEVLRMGDMARTWLAARQLKRLVVPLYIPGAVAAGFRAGYNCTPNRAVGRVTWQDWLNHKYGAQAPSSLKAAI